SRVERGINPLTPSPGVGRPPHPGPAAGRTRRRGGEPRPRPHAESRRGDARPPGPLPDPTRAGLLLARNEVALRRGAHRRPPDKRGELPPGREALREGTRVQAPSAGPCSAVRPQPQP